MGIAMQFNSPGMEIRPMQKLVRCARFDRKLLGQGYLRQSR